MVCFAVSSHYGMCRTSRCAVKMHLSDYVDDAPCCDMQRGQCVLHVASGYGYPQMVKTLLQFKAHADCRDEVCPVILSYHAFTQA